MRGRHGSERREWTRKRTGNAAARTSTRYVAAVAAGAAVGGLLSGYHTPTMNAAINGIRSALGLGSEAVGSVIAVALIGGAAVIVVAVGTPAVRFSTASGSGDALSLGHAVGLTALAAMLVFSIAFGITRRARSCG